jgi:NAD(P)-dependent dehydrogenase (short-subunit alcohol dehydrogenase family)
MGPGLGAVVTGAGSGIGRAIARRLASEGLRVVLADVDPAVTALADELGAAVAVGNVASEAGAARVFALASEELGEIDIWFGNAGIERGRGLATSEHEWHDSYEVNVLAHVRAARLLLPHWLERGRGRLVITASAAGLLTMLGSPAYSVTKHGAVAFAEWLSATYRHRGIVVQAICPQGVQTRMLESAGELHPLMTRDGIRTADEVAEAAWQGLAHDRFFVLPHPKVARYVQAKASDEDGWLAGMNRIQQRLGLTGDPA